VNSEIVSSEVREWARGCVRRIVQQPAEPLPVKRRRNLLLVHLDGVPKVFLDRAIASGRMPFLARLVRSGAYHLDGAFWGSPASTPSFQASLLYGLRHPGLPAYEWFDRELNRKVQMNRPQDAKAIEARLERRAGTSLLAEGGSAYLSLFRAEASRGLCLTSLTDKLAIVRSLRADWSQIRSVEGARRGPLLKAVAREAINAASDALRWTWQHRDGRHEARFVYRRIMLLSLAWKVVRRRAMIDMVRGVPAIYLVYGNFDEVAHRRGPFSSSAAGELYGVDDSLERLYAVAREAPHRYDVVFLTDHGHVDSAPFEREAGSRLEDALARAPEQPLGADLERGLLDGRSRADPLPARAVEDPIVVEAGNFAHVYLTRGHPPLEALEIVSRHREVLASAVQMKQIGIVALRQRDSAVAIINGAIYRPGEIECAPLSSAFSKRAVADLLAELPAMPTAGDIVLFGQTTSAEGTIGFAWEFGSHGGLTRRETESMVCWPADSPLDLGALHHSAQLHERLSEVYRT